MKKYELLEKDKEYNREILNDCQNILLAFNVSYNNCIINYDMYNNENILKSIEKINYCIEKNKNKNNIYNFSRKYNIHPDYVNDFCNLYNKISSYIGN